MTPATGLQFRYMVTDFLFVAVLHKRSLKGLYSSLCERSFTGVLTRKVTYNMAVSVSPSLGKKIFPPTYCALWLAMLSLTIPRVHR